MISSTNLSDGATLVSNDGSFELGFFSSGSSTKSRYLGIWLKKISVQTVVWVANRCDPINDTSGVLMINSTGNLVLLSQSGSVVWAPNSRNGAQNPVLQLSDSGNLVLKDRIAGKTETLLWQSFDYPTNSWLPGMKLGWDLKTDLNRRLSAWKSSDDPCPGDLTLGIERYNYPDLVMWKGSNKYFRAGGWDGIGATGLRLPEPNLYFTFNVTINEEEIYIIYTLKIESIITTIVLNQTSSRLQRTIWNEEARTWVVYSQLPTDDCDNYGMCAAYETCFDTSMPPCQCLKGFKPKSQEWNSVDLSSQGCAWRLWKEGSTSQLIDSFVLESCTLTEALRCIHISLLCVQHQPEDRPSMSSIVLMLGSENTLVQPKEPNFLVHSKSNETISSSSKPESSSTNELSLSMLEPR
ncbi:hypothetical protein SLEP1_g57283 [Rubroshorea leprosula]|uniref:Bulb-type lectin domain-containing protein n=1 Tax=Rubroshorea leprosula TaxID=152421 RepID=A0AAV5MLZ7_9ROSI|nr:hypothetical protein SLEP1_g57283 [Rubroshorea leprosula]